MKKALIGLFAILILAGCASYAQVYNVKDFGAVPDGKTVNTKAIQRAFDSCSKNGGQVLIPVGVFLSGTLYFKSNVHIKIEPGGILKGSAAFEDYPDNKVNYKNAFTHYPDGKQYPNKAFLFAEGVQDISITGGGAIDGSGDSPGFQLGDDSTLASRTRPCLLLIIDSKKIRLSGIQLRNSAYWMQNYLGCEDLELRNLNIFNQSNYNQDGIDIDAKNVLIENCVIDVDDDGICFKSHDRNRPVENAVVRNCTIASNCNAIKFGTMSLGGLKNLTVSNCTIKRASADHIRQWQKKLAFIEQPVTVISGIALEAVDGGVVEDVKISNIQMKDVQTPLFIVLGRRGRKQPGEVGEAPVGKIRNVVIRNVTAVSHSKMSSSITAFPGAYVENIVLQHISISGMGKGTLSEANLPLKEAPTSYPENRMYGEVYPASGLFIRHVKGITLQSIYLRVRNSDSRPAIILDDVMNAKMHL
ncbi:MAG: glycoside hydrolase family 28 protein [Niastella sp.]|uniref:glycoside hydrolase family 28 protein n=1 Tax=Niastella sp. TaxID=1869183 RepID=UPI00389B0352